MNRTVTVEYYDNKPNTFFVQRLYYYNIILSRTVWLHALDAFNPTCDLYGSLAMFMI